MPDGLESFSTDDIWAQDFFETAYTSMPSKDGPHVMRIALRSANLYSDSNTSPLRRAGRVAFTRFRTRDSAGVQQYDLKSDPDMDSLNSMGNFETIPPFAVGDEKWPVGRILRGSIPKFHPDASFSKMLEAQQVQKPVLVDTSWLLVGHVDETISFVKSATPRGWKLLVNDPTLARKMLEDAGEAGHGDVVMFDGPRWPTNKGTRAAVATISEVLDDALRERARSEEEVRGRSTLASEQCLDLAKAIGEVRFCGASGGDQGDEFPRDGGGEHRLGESAGAPPEHLVHRLAETLHPVGPDLHEADVGEAARPLQVGEGVLDEGPCDVARVDALHAGANQGHGHRLEFNALGLQCRHHREDVLDHVGEGSLRAEVLVAEDPSEVGPGEGAGHPAAEGQAEVELRVARAVAEVESEGALECAER